MFSAENIKKQFPVFNQPHPSGKELIYLDNAATTQKPIQVLEAIQKYYITSNANVGRGIYDLAHRATTSFEGTRTKVAHFLQAKPEEIIFTKGTTDSINLVASAFLEPQLKAGMNVVVTQMEHHANFIPWQQLCLKKGAAFRVVPITVNGDIDLEEMDRMIDENTQIVACTHVSNTIGTINPISKIISLAKKSDVPVLIDGAQAVVSKQIDVSKMGADFYCFSGHKLFGPTGIGILFGRKELLDRMSPYQTGGGMINSVSNYQTDFAPAPLKFEAGTPNMAGVAGLDAAIDFVISIGQEDILHHVQSLNHFAVEKLKSIENLQLLPGGEKQSGICSFYFPYIHPHDVATILDQYGIAVRAGHHCTEPLMKFLNIHGTVRVSFSVYNTIEDVNFLAEVLQEVRKIFH